LELADKVRAAKRVYIIGNGGSYANAQHIANDLLSCGVRAFTFDAATYTAFANDFGFESAYQRWISVVGEKADLLLALSGSGRSPNILAAIAEGERIGMVIHREFGYPKGLDMQQAEEAQLRLGHDLMRALRDRR
jgi:D-sedoheptulose 7-phosphate isomerase